MSHNFFYDFKRSNKGPTISGADKIPLATWATCHLGILPVAKSVLSGDHSSDRIDSFWSANFDSPNWNKNKKKDFDSRSEAKSFFLFVIYLGESFYFLFWFILFQNSFGFLFILICDSIWFYSKIKSNQKSKVGESWFALCRIIDWFDFESKVNQSESRIKLPGTKISISNL